MRLLLVILLAACSGSPDGPDGPDGSTGSTSSSTGEATTGEAPTQCLAADCVGENADCSEGLSCALHEFSSSFVCAPGCSIRTPTPGPPVPGQPPISYPPDTCNPLRDEFACDDDPPILFCGGVNDEDLRCLPKLCKADEDCDTRRCIGGYCRVAQWSG